MILAAWSPLTVHAQEIPATVPDDAVYAVLFYLPTCGHCHDVIDNHIPPMQAEFGDSFQVLYIDSSTPTGANLHYAACNSLNVPDHSCGPVPFMVIGENYLVGSYDIPNEAPGLIRNGIQAGGIGLEAVPDVQQAYQAFLNQSATGTENGVAVDEANNSTLTVLDRLTADPAGNALAVVVLIGLSVSVGLIGIAYLRRLPISARLGQQAATATVAAGAGVALLLALGETTGDSLPRLLAIGVMGLLIGAMTLLQNQDARSYAVPVIVLAGGIVAAYLTHIETTETAAFCGAVGDCSAVQASPYATLFGVLPVGVLGLIGYGMIAGAWLWVKQTGEDRAKAALFGLSAIGAAFSIYLTFLEPFIIGATCAWCVTSALTMLGLLWITAPEGIPAFRRLTGRRA